MFADYRVCMFLKMGCRLSEQEIYMTLKTRPYAIFCAAS